LQQVCSVPCGASYQEEEEEEAVEEEAVEEEEEEEDHQSRLMSMSHNNLLNKPKM